MITVAMYFLPIMSQWINFIFLYMRSLEVGSPLRRWWVKPHITEQMRNLFGAYQSLFFYFFEQDHDHRLIKTSPRKPLSKKLRLFFTLR